MKAMAIDGFGAPPSLHDLPTWWTGSSPSRYSGPTRWPTSREPSPILRQAPAGSWPSACHNRGLRYTVCGSADGEIGQQRVAPRR